jgi:NADPH2:quinone reductase
VIGSVGWGGMAEEIAVSSQRARKIPDSVPFDEAAAFMMTYGTSHYALKDRASLKPGETLLVLGAAGGVGVAAVELGKAMGARVIAAVSSPEKLAFAKACGADDGILYPLDLDERDRDGAKAFSEAIKKAGGGGVDVIYDAVGGAYAEPALRALNWDGRFLVIGFPAGIPKMPLNLTLLKSCQIVGVFWGAFTARDPKANEDNIAALFDLYESGQIKPRISAHFPLERGGEAIRLLADRKALGKVVVTI